MPEKAENKQKPVPVNRNTVVGTIYSQGVGVYVTDFDITLEFAYMNPQATLEGAEGNVVARITLPRLAGEGLYKLIADTIAQHEEKKKK